MAGDHGGWGHNGSRQVIPTRSLSSDWDGPLLTIVQPLPDGPPEIRRTEELSAAVSELINRVDALQEAQTNLTASVARWQADLRSARDEIRALQQSLEPGKPWWTDLLSPVTLVGVLILVLTIGPMLPLPSRSTGNAVNPPVITPLAIPRPAVTLTAPVQAPPMPPVRLHRSSHPSRPKAKTGRSRGNQR
jgi:hypothetical protein